MVKNFVRSAIAALRNSKGVSALEYGILAAIIVGAVATAALSLGSSISTAFSGIGATLNKDVSSASK